VVAAWTGPLAGQVVQQAAERGNDTVQVTSNRPLRRRDTPVVIATLSGTSPRARKLAALAAVPPGQQATRHSLHRAGEPTASWDQAKGQAQVT
jgi:hypothetical protein